MHTQRRYATCPQGMSKKREKRCISKEGMPHASKAWQKEKENIAHTKNIQGREKSYKGVSSTIHQKNIHTLAHHQGLWLVSPLDPVFDLAKYEKQVCHHILHTYRSTKKKSLEVGWKRKTHKKALVRNETHLSDPRDHPRNYNISFQKLYKNLRIDGWTKEWQVVLYKPFWPSTAKDEDDAKSPTGVR